MRIKWLLGNKEKNIEVTDTTRQECSNSLSVPSRYGKVVEKIYDIIPQQENEKTSEQLKCISEE